jgi:hypothetical protein
LIARFLTTSPSVFTVLRNPPTHIPPTANRDIPLWLLALILGAACILGYYPVLSIGFLCDDFVFLYSMHHGSLAATALGGLYFRPLVILLSALDWFIAGDHPLWFHIVNLAWHFAASIGVAVLAGTLLKRPFAALIAGLIFALHPAHPEAVAWISGRFDLICGTLLIWSFVCYIRQRESASTRSRFLAALSVTLFALACLSKEQAFVFPLTLLLYELIPFHPLSPAILAIPANPAKAKILRTLPYFAVAAIVFGVRWAIIGGMGGYIAESTHEHLPSAILFHAVVQPFEILFLPINRSLFEPMGTQWLIVMEIILFAPLLLIFRARWRILLFCMVAIILNTIPSAHLGIAGGALQNSRFLYTASTFFSILMAGLFTADFKGRIRSMALILAAVYCLTMLFILNQNNYAWQEAGRLVRTAAMSAEPLIERHTGEWGVNKQRLVMFNVPMSNIGAWTFQTGLPEMLRLKYGNTLEEVELEVVPAGLQTQQNIEKVEFASRDRDVVWLFDTRTWSFLESEGD